MDRVSRIIGSKWAHDRGILGRHIGIAVLDTGITMHPDFGNRILTFKDFVNHRSKMYDDYGHGTHIAGIVAGNGKMSKGRYCGVAPEADIIALKVLDFRGNGNVPTLLYALEWILENQKTYHIQVVNISVGTSARDGLGENSDLVKAVNCVWDSGLVVCVASGNNGPSAGSVTTPGISRKVITVGSSERTQSSDYSGRGPNDCCIIKPDLVAPGSFVCSCKSMSRTMSGVHQNQYYTIKSGTSMATPMVSGAAALFLSRYPFASNAIIKKRLCETAYDMGLESGRQGFGRVDIKSLLERKR